MDPATARPHFELSELTPQPQWILEEIEDINGDALGARCGKCRAALSWAQWILMEGRGDPIDCHSCGERLIGSPDCGEIAPGKSAEVLSKDYLDRVWYHATEDPSWLKTVQSPWHGDLLVHVGDRLSALARADFIGRRPKLGGRRVYLYSFRIELPDSFAPAIGDDMGRSWQTRLSWPVEMRRARLQGEDHGRHEGHLTLTEETPLPVYYNRFEVPGSFSLLLSAALIDGASLSMESWVY